MKRRALTAARRLPDSTIAEEEGRDRGRAVDEEKIWGLVASEGGGGGRASGGASAQLNITALKTYRTFGLPCALLQKNTSRLCKSSHSFYL